MKREPVQPYGYFRQPAQKKHPSPTEKFFLPEGILYPKLWDVYPKVWNVHPKAWDIHTKPWDIKRVGQEKLFSRHTERIAWGGNYT